MRLEFIGFNQTKAVKGSASLVTLKAERTSHFFPLSHLPFLKLGRGLGKQTLKNQEKSEEHKNINFNIPSYFNPFSFTANNYPFEFSHGLSYFKRLFCFQNMKKEFICT